MKSPMFILERILADASIQCRTSTTLDFNTVQRRVEHEGISFLTIALPAFCRDFEEALDLGQISSHHFFGFSRRRTLRAYSGHNRQSGVIPQFLGGILELVFDEFGYLLDNPDITAIFFIRQICLMNKKILLETTEERKADAFKKYVECENEVSEFSVNIQQRDLNHFADVSHLLWDHILCDVDRKVYEADIIPKHGPGATAERISGNRKYAIRKWHSRLEEFFPSAEFLIPNAGFFRELDSVDFVEPEAESPSRIISVPKTLKTPRIIAIEPVCMQYTQQSLLEVLVQHLEGSTTLNGSVGFTDQSPNRDMAREGSLSDPLDPDGLCTIDLSEASDRVSNLLVKTMLQAFPHLSGAVQACRTVSADVPGFGVIPLSKFASMGSATTFPIEAMVFLTIVISAYVRSQGRSTTQKRLKDILSRVRVYGDDIIVPRHIVLDVKRELETYGLKVNAAKSFWTGKFRESCGKDFYDGNDVTVVYNRRLLPSSYRDASEMLSLVSFRNQLYLAGLWETVKYLDGIIGRLAPFPIVEDTSPVLGRRSFLPYRSERDDPYLHRPLVRGLVVKAKPRPSCLDDSYALLKFFLKRGVEPIFDKKHLERYGRPQRVDTKVAWSCPY